ncbi:MAG: LEA type 2 family protein [Candidatus Wenzhouxiangella sp. M2_3B_020]
MNAPRVAIAAAVLCALLAACSTGPRKVRSEPPGLQVENLALEPSRVELGLILHNRNDHPITVTGAQLTMRVEGELLLDEDWPLALDIGPRLREHVRLEASARGDAVRRLENIMAERDASIAFRLTGELRIDGIDDSGRSVRGFLHPVPGQPGQFR